MPRIGRAYSSAVWIRLDWMCTVPFGAPVEPDEYNQKQGSSQVVATASKRSDAVSINAPSASTPLPPATMMRSSDSTRSSSGAKVS
jgi:hypothetical protein